MNFLPLFTPCKRVMQNKVCGRIEVQMRTMWMSVAALMSALVFAGCSVDVDVDNAKGTKSSRNGKTDGEARRNKTAADELEAKRDAEEASYSPTNAAPLYVTKPMAW